jgi:3-phenylpropionate/cinnamic acid dioxygenase small subunit
VTDPRLDIQSLLFRYAERIDAGDFAGIGELFAEGVIAAEDGTPLARGSDEVAGLYGTTTRRYPDGTPRTLHVTTNVIVELDADGRRAEARSAFTVLQATDDLPLQPIIAGRYRDRFHRDDEGRWWFTERRMCPTVLGDLSHHLLFDAAALEGTAAQGPDDASDDQEEPQP